MTMTLFHFSISVSIESCYIDPKTQVRVIGDVGALADVMVEFTTTCPLGHWDRRPVTRSWVGLAVPAGTIPLTDRI